MSSVPPRSPAYIHGPARHTPVLATAIPSLFEGGLGLEHSRLLPKRRQHTCLSPPTPFVLAGRAVAAGVGDSERGERAAVRVQEPDLLQLHLPGVRRSRPRGHSCRDMWTRPSRRQPDALTTPHHATHLVQIPTLPCYSHRGPSGCAQGQAGEVCRTVHSPTLHCCSIPTSPSTFLQPPPTSNKTSPPTPGQRLPVPICTATATPCTVAEAVKLTASDLVPVVSSGIGTR